MYGRGGWATAAAVTLMVSLVALPAGASSASTPPMAVTISPATGQAGVAADYVETYKANAAISGATISTVVPATWTAPQTTRPAGAGYVSAARGTCTAVGAVSLTAVAGGTTRVTVSGVSCPSNGRLTLTYSGASTTAAASYTFGPTTVTVGRTTSTIGSAAVKVGAAVTSRFGVVAAAAGTVAGAAYKLTVTPLDAFGNTSSYAGTVAFSSTDHGASTVLPASTAITGAHAFSAILTTAGPQAITVRSTTGTPVSGSLSGITVNPGPTAGLTISGVAPVASTPRGQLPAGQQLAYTLTATDRYANVTPAYAGKVLTTSSTDTHATLPAAYTFVPGTDHGSHDFRLTPGAAGSQTYRATDASHATITGTTMLGIAIGVQPHSATPFGGTVGTPFSQAFTAVGATGAVTWSGTHLPAGLSVDPSTGVLSGTPTSGGDQGTFTITATDSASPAHTGSWDYSLSDARGSQTVAFTSSAPRLATNGGADYLASASATSGLGATISSETTSVCTVAADGTVSFAGGGTCTLDADQAGSADWLPAATTQQTFSVRGGIPQTVSFTSRQPTHAAVGGATYTPTATSTSGLPVGFTIDDASSSVCSIDQATGEVAFQAVGTCTIDTVEPAQAPYDAAPQVQQSFLVARGFQTVAFTSTAPSGVEVGDATYQATAGATPSGLTVAISSEDDTVCTVADDGTVTATGPGTCTLDAVQSGDPNWLPASLATQSFTVTSPVPLVQTIGFTSTAPADAVVGGDTYTPTATVSPSNAQVDLTVDSSSSSVCSIDSTTGAVSYQAIGTCTIDANLDPSSPYTADQVQQSFQVGKGSQAVSFTTTAPSDAYVAGPTYSPQVQGAPSPNAVGITVDDASTTVCEFSPTTGALNFVGAGTCTLDATQGGDSNWSAASTAVQSFSVGGAQLGVTSNPVDNPVVVSLPPNTDPTCGGQQVGTIVDGGCFMGNLSASDVNVFDATATMDTADPGFDPSLYSGRLSYHWSFYKPPQLSSTLYASNGITGYHAPVLTIQPSALPDLPGALVVYPYWTVRLDVTDAGGNTTTAYFHFEYDNSLVSVALSTFCQTPANVTTAQCHTRAPNGLPAPLSFTSPTPTAAVVGGSTYTPVAVFEATQAPVTLTIDSASSAVCALDTSTGAVSYQSVGTCTIDANLNPLYGAAAQVQQSFQVGQGSQAVSFTTTAPSDAYVAGPTYSPQVLGAPSPNAVDITVDDASTGVCTFSPATGALNFVGDGTCTLDATQAGDADWTAAPTVQQSFRVGAPRIAITANPIDDPQVVPVPPNTNNCDPQTPTSGGCLIDPLDGTGTNLLDGTGGVATTDPGFDPSLYAGVLGFHWQIYKPPGLGSALYSSNGITGYHAPVLSILDSSLPELLGTGAGQYIFWTIQLTETYHGATLGVVFFKFQYTSSTLTLKLSTTCQAAGNTPQCVLSASHGLGATEPT